MFLIVLLAMAALVVVFLAIILIMGAVAGA